MKIGYIGLGNMGGPMAASGQLDKTLVGLGFWKAVRPTLTHP